MSLTVEDAWENYYGHSGSASAGVRRLAFTGIVMVWLLSGGGLLDGEEVSIRGHLVAPLILMMLALAFDLAQYAYLAVVWRLFARHREVVDRDADFHAPRRLNTVGEVCFVAKILLVVTGHVWLLLVLPGLA